MEGDRKKELDNIFELKEDTPIKVSFSKYSSFDRKGPRVLETKEVVQNDGATIGRLVDDLLFESKEHFKKNYIVFNGTKPTATTGKLVDIILDFYVELPTQTQVLNIIEENEFWKRSKTDTILKNLDDNFYNYLNVYFDSKINKKTIITTEELMLAEDLKDILLTHEYSKNIFKSNYQPQIKFKYNYSDVLIRGIIDMVVIDEKNKTIRFIDLKTGSNNADDFIKSFVKYRYYFQAYLYQLAFEEFKKISKYKDYTLLPFQFLYISRFEKLPLIFEVSDKWLNAAKYGFTFGSYEYKGIDKLTEEIKWHFKNNEFKLSKEIKESNGKIDLKGNLITVKNE